MFNHKDKSKIIYCFLLVFLIFLFFMLPSSSEIESRTYEEAVSLYIDGQYDEAIELFSLVDQYKDSNHYIQCINSYQLIEDKKPYEALSILASLEEFPESRTLYERASKDIATDKWNIAIQQIESEEFGSAYNTLLSIDTAYHSLFEDYDLVIQSTRWDLAIQQMESKEPELAYNTLLSIDDEYRSLFKEYDYFIQLAKWDMAIQQMESGELDSAYYTLLSIDTQYRDLFEEYNTTSKLVNTYIYSPWVGTWENRGFNKKRVTKIRIVNGIPYIALYGSIDATKPYELIPYPQNDSVYSNWLNGDIVLLNRNQMSFYNDSYDTSFIWKRSGTNATDTFSSKYESVTRKKSTLSSDVPYYGMSSSKIGSTSLGHPTVTEKCRDYYRLRPERRSISYEWYENGKLIFAALEYNGEIISVNDFR